MERSIAIPNEHTDAKKMERKNKTIRLASPKSLSLLTAPYHLSACGLAYINGRQPSQTKLLTKALPAASLSPKCHRGPLDDPIISCPWGGSTHQIHPACGVHPSALQD